MSILPNNLVLRKTEQNIKFEQSMIFTSFGYADINTITHMQTICGNHFFFVTQDAFKKDKA